VLELIVQMFGGDRQAGEVVISQLSVYERITEEEEEKSSEVTSPTG
jgi:hypothetical protein